MQTCQTRVNLEMAATAEMIAIATRLKPPHCCLVPEKRAELTTEGGLDVVANEALLKDACMRLAEAGIEVSLFIDADGRQIEAAQRCGAAAIEIHTGHYAEAESLAARQRELQRIRRGVEQGRAAGLIVNAGHGLHYHNTLEVAAIPGINELNIGHSIVARAVLTGLDEAVRTMRALIDQGAALAK
jgi:pyridoxine 5-phosphate synthase